MSHDSSESRLMRMSHESWLTWVRTLVNESWLMTHVSQANPKWVKSIWVGKIPIQNVWEIWAPCILYGRLTVTLADRRKCCRHKINLLGRSRACPKGVLRQLRPIRSAFLLRPVWVQDLNLPSLLSAAAAETCTRIPIYKSMRDQYPVRPSNQNMHGWPGMEVFLPGWSGKIL